MAKNLPGNVSCEDTFPKRQVRPPKYCERGQQSIIVKYKIRKNEVF